MAFFKYEALTENGRVMEGTLEAGDFDLARAALEAMKLSVNNLEKTDRQPRPTAIGRDDFILFNQQLATITQSGIPLEKALRAVAAEAASGQVRQLTREIAGDLEKGIPVEQAFARHEKAFPVMYGRILKAGIQSGRLSEMLVSLNHHLKVAGRTRSILLDTLTYPAIVLVVIAAVTILVSTLVLRVTTDMFSEDFGTDLPQATQALIYIAQHIIPIWIGVAGLMVLATIFTIILKQTTSGRSFLERFLSGIPLVGPIFRFGKLSHFSDCMALLIRGGCDGPEALITSARAVNCESLIQESDLVARQIQQGAGYMEAGQICAFIPRLFFYSLQIGAQRNEIETNLSHLSQMYQDRLSALQKQLSAFLVPALLVLLGFIVGGTLIMLFAPMISMLEGLT